MQFRFQLSESLWAHNLLIICILLLFSHLHTSLPRILKQQENSGSWHCSCQEISFLQQEISIASISDHQPMTLQIWSWRNSKDIAVPNCDAAEGLLWKHYLIKTRSNQKRLLSADHVKPMFRKVFIISSLPPPSSPLTDCISYFWARFTKLHGSLRHTLQLSVPRAMHAKQCTLAKSN